MAEAEASLPKEPSRVILTLALLEARAAVKRQLRDKGITLSSLKASEITIAARAYFKEHPQELAEEAWRKMKGSAALMRSYEKEQRQRAKRAKSLASALSRKGFRCANVTFKMGSGK
jgi:hypothetical protein